METIYGFEERHQMVPPIDPEYEFPEEATKIHSKFDPTTWGYPA